jgi:hypothetical protein
MSARTLLEVALRLLGICLCLVAITHMTANVSFLLLNPWAVTDFLSFFAPVVVQLLLGFLLIVFARRIAAWFYPRNEEVLQIAVGPGDIYRTACFVLGVYLLVQAAVPAGRLVGSGYARLVWMPQDVATLVELIVDLACGVWLVFGSRSISEFLRRLGYDANAIPAQRFSIAALFIILLVVALAFGLIRMLVVRG